MVGPVRQHPVELILLRQVAARLTTPVALFDRDGRLIYLTSSVLFSNKLERIKRNPKVALAISDPAAMPTGRFHRAAIQGDARVDDADIHHGWERVLPLWRAKEPAIDALFSDDCRHRRGL